MAPVIVLIVGGKWAKRGLNSAPNAKGELTAPRNAKSRIGHPKVIY
jgi:hypothetical protein